MNCSLNVDWKAYALGEMPAAQRSSAASHMVGCVSCREELAGVEATLATLAMLHEEEVPRRIAFVSDKVFEPRWWQRWNPTFAAASVLAAAIVLHAFVQAPVSDGTTQARLEQIEQVDREMKDRMVLLDQLDKRLQPVYMQQARLERQ
jgi:anti-sigma factor RsiW